MALPYREPQDHDQLAVVLALPATLLNRVAVAVLLYIPWPLPVRARSVDREAARAARMKRIGNCCEWFLLVPFWFATQVWIDEACTTQARLSWRGFQFNTYFESGRCIITWNHSPRTQSSKRLDSRSGSGVFARDLESHQEAVKRAMAAGDAPVRVESARAAALLGRHYYRHVSSTAVALEVLTVQAVCAAFLWVPLLRHVFVYVMSYVRRIA
jgi:hypothetical protein